MFSQDKKIQNVADSVRKIMDEALKGNQAKLDVDNDKKIEASDLAKLRAMKNKMKEETEELDELSVNKMLKYTDAANKNREVLNKKWDTGTATEREKNKVLGHEKGEESAAARIKAKTGKNPNEIG